MGDRGHNRHGPKRKGGCCASFTGGAGFPSNTMWPLPYQVASSSIQPFGHNRREPKTGGVPLLEGAATPCNTTSHWPRFTSVISGIWSIQPFNHNRHEPKIGGGCALFFCGGARSPSNTKSPGPRPKNWFALCYGTVVLCARSVCDVGVLWPNGWMDQDETFDGGRPRPRPDCVRWGPSSQKMGTQTQFSDYVCRGQTAGWR